MTGVLTALPDPQDSPRGLSQRVTPSKRKTSVHGCRSFVSSRRPILRSAPSAPSRGETTLSGVVKMQGGPAPIPRAGRTRHRITPVAQDQQECVEKEPQCSNVYGTMTTYKSCEAQHRTVKIMGGLVG